jgi:hypothetical protein
LKGFHLWANSRISQKQISSTFLSYADCMRTLFC